MLLLNKATGLPRGFQISQLIYPLHVAAVGGPVYLWLLFVSGLLPLLLWLLGDGWRRARLRQERGNTSKRCATTDGFRFALPILQTNNQ